MEWTAWAAPYEVLVTLLARNRLFFVVSLALFGATLGLTTHILRPDGLVRARELAWGPRERVPPSEVRGVPADRSGGECGLEHAGGLRALRGCHAYQAPEVVRVGDRTLVVWEEHDDAVAVSALASDLSLDRTVRFPRPRTDTGVLLPRTGVAVGEDRLAIRYHRGQVITVGADLAAWPGGALEVASARIGPRGTVLAGGLLGLVLLYLSVTGWVLRLPGALARHAREGRCLSVTLPERGSTVVIDGHAVELDLGQTWVIGADPTDLPGQPVTLVVADRTAGQAYRDRDRLAPAQLWPGTLADALARARGMRAGTLALALTMSSLLLLALDAYLVW